MNAEDTVPTILITGAARRVGAAIARTLHASGARVILHYRSSAVAAEQLAAALNSVRPDSALLLRGDLRQDGMGEHLVSSVIDQVGRLDGLVNNASSFFPTPVGEIRLADWDDLIGSNLKGPLFLSQAAAPHLKRNHGAIVNIIDIHAERPLSGYPLYCAAKAGLLGLTRALALELAPQVRVNGVSPGPIAWPDDDLFSADERAAIVNHTLLRREGEPQDIAGAVRYLMLDAPYVTGQIIAVDGGRSAHL